MEKQSRMSGFGKKRAAWLRLNDVQLLASVSAGDENMNNLKHCDCFHIIVISNHLQWN
ncbi:MULTISPECIES: hypothetical protein [unclassified Paenibacillus]|uniref:hypothetical protein n=1 Tax=unclassified Paenibacillus TaxID=185978 RepID=UPI003F80CA26